MNKSKKGKIFKFLGEHWYIISNIVIIILMIVLTIIMFLQKPKNQDNMINQSNNCQNNTENYITDVIVSEGTECPDGYFDVNQTDIDDKFVKINNNVTKYKMCFKQPDSICNGDLVVTNLNINSLDEKCNSDFCNKDNQSEKNIKCTDGGADIDMYALGCRCKNCGDLPIGHYNKNKDGTNMYNSNCGGMIQNSKNKSIICMTQELYNSKTKGISGISYILDTGYSTIKNTNVYFKK